MKIRHDIWSLCQDFKLGPPKYEVGVVTTWPHQTYIPSIAQQYLSCCDMCAFFCLSLHIISLLCNKNVVINAIISMSDMLLHLLLLLII
jgi:hypothetical protein